MSFTPARLRIHASQRPIPNTRPILMDGSCVWWGKVDSNHRRHCQQIYSLSPLATREFPHIQLPTVRWSWWTDSNPRPADYKSAALPAELHQRFRSARQPAYNSKYSFICQQDFFRFIKNSQEGLDCRLNRIPERNCSRNKPVYPIVTGGVSYIRRRWKYAL